MKDITRRGFIGVGATAAMAAVLTGCSVSTASSSASSSAASGSASASSAASGSASASSAAKTLATDAKGTGEALDFVTGNSTGTYFGFGTVIAQHANKNVGVNITAREGAGSQKNVNELKNGTADLAFCQSDVMAYAYNGTNLFQETGAITNFSTVAALYGEQVQIVTLDENIKSVADLAGKRVSIGEKGSGVYFNALDVLGAYDIDPETGISPVNLSFSDSAADLKDEKIDAAFIVAGAPTTAITELGATKSPRLVSLDDEHIEKLLKVSDYYTKATIPAATYGLDSDVTTVAVSAVILAEDSVANDDVYALVYDIFENSWDLEHDKASELDVNKAAAITSVPYHPGAKKYFDEKGLTVTAK